MKSQPSQWISEKKKNRTASDPRRRYSFQSRAAYCQNLPVEPEPGKPKPVTLKLCSGSGAAKLVRRLRKDAGLQRTFTLDACRHGGMTELEEAELTDG
jgi:hypothetical protein